uniref:Uncharacterized protein n=1 Tax=Ixodes ricinus TaxID=34613 RepID=A0A147BCR3_IXORI
MTNFLTLYMNISTSLLFIFDFLCESFSYTSSLFLPCLITFFRLCLSFNYFLKMGGGKMLYLLVNYFPVTSSSSVLCPFYFLFFTKKIKDRVSWQLRSSVVVPFRVSRHHILSGERGWRDSDSSCLQTSWRNQGLQKFPGSAGFRCSSVTWVHLVPMHCPWNAADTCSATAWE